MPALEIEPFPKVLYSQESDGNPMSPKAQDIPTDLLSVISADVYSSALAAGALIVLSLIVGLFGYRFLRWSVALLGFLMGAVPAAVFASIIFPENTALTLVFALIGGVGGWMLLSFILQFGLFVLGFTAGLVLAGILEQAGIIQSSTSIEGFALAVTMGILGVLWQRPMLILFTAALASISTILTLLIMLQGGSLPMDFSIQTWPFPKESLAAAVWLFLTITFAYVQMRYTAPRRT